tara:strand:+ start:233 stop:607 length:375 start_codon:yes stop_codon:yes gene_type:complete
MAYKDTTEYGFGQLGSMFIDASGAAKPPTGKVFVAITFLSDTKFDTAGGLIASQDTENGLEYITTVDGSSAGDPAHNSGVPTRTSGSGGLIIDVANVFPRGVTIYGRYAEIDIASGSLIAYIGE